MYNFKKILDTHTSNVYKTVQVIIISYFVYNEGKEFLLILTIPNCVLGSC